MTPRLSILYFAVPGFLACIMVLASATVIIVADSLKSQIFYGSLIIAGIATSSWLFGMVLTTKRSEWGMLLASIALISAFGVIVIAAITAYWITVLDPLNLN